MANLQESSEAPSTSTSVANRSGQQQHDSNMQRLTLIMENLIEDLQNPATRGRALAFLYKKMGDFHEHLAPLLWHSCGSNYALIQEITSIYILLSTPNLTQRISIRASRAVCLFKCIASHPATSKQFLRAGYLVYIEPFMETEIQGNQPHENLRTTSLGVIASLVALDDAEVVHLLLGTKIFLWCITSLNVGNVKSKTLAACIIHKILKHNAALDLCCSDARRFFSLLEPLTSIFRQLAVEPSPNLLKHVILCCLRLTNNIRALDALTSSLPLSISYRALSRQIDDPVVMNCLTTLIRKVTGRAMQQRHSVRNYN